VTDDTIAVKTEQEFACQQLDAIAILTPAYTTNTSSKMTVDDTS
jgi:hypothetical protein